jgi:hypothetical protein
LKHASLIRFKLFTLDATLSLGWLGRLSDMDRTAVMDQLHRLLPQAEIRH